MKKYVKGNFKKSLFESNSGYMIGLLKVVDTNDLDLEDYIDKTITFTGFFTELKIDQSYILYGDLIDHPKYGFQYQVSEYKKILPEDKEGIIEFLSSDLFAGVGSKLATSIVNLLGIEALDKILENKYCLNNVPKITNKKIELIYDTLNKYGESHKIVVYLTEIGLNIKDALSIYNRYKENTMLIIENNIFSIIEDIEGISFNKINDISYKLNYEKNDKRRVKSCIVYIMSNLTYENGDTYSYFDEIKEKVLKYLRININDELFSLYMDELRLENKIIKIEEQYYLKELFLAEKEIAEKIKCLLDKNIDKYKKMDKYLLELEEVYEIKYNKKQVEAVKKSLENNIVIITGGPGTGKTTIIKAIVEMYQKLNKCNYEESLRQIALLAPTGRASKRMSESTLFPATTIHRFLKWNKDNNSFNINEYNKDFSKFIIVDEVSMLDTYLLANLFKGLTDDIKIVLVGDYNQLPSVGPGQILKDLIESNMIDVIELDLLYRQSEESYITELALEINKNELRKNYLEPKQDYTFLKCSSNSLKENVKKICEQLVKKNYDYKKVQLLAPMYAGKNGIDNLNKELQNVFNPYAINKEEIKYGDVIFRENDKILQLVNMADSNVFNGDVGVISLIIPANKSETKKNEIYVDYDGIEVKYLPSDFYKIKHGYIISIHKSQGSEFELVIMPLCKDYNRMLYKKIIYTGVTRAKNKLILLGESEAFEYGVNNNNEKERKTNLKNNLQKNV